MSDAHATPEASLRELAEARLVTTLATLRAELESTRAALRKVDDVRWKAYRAGFLDGDTTHAYETKVTLAESRATEYADARAALDAAARKKP